MSVSDIEELDWSIRAMVYRHIVAEGKPPTTGEMAVVTGLALDQMLAVYRRLHDRHALFLAADGETIRMANPFSGVPTPFRVRSGGQSYWANCAWDALGVPAALHADATITAKYADDGGGAVLAVRGGAVEGSGFVHFLTPFQRWYDDLIHT